MSIAAAAGFGLFYWFINWDCGAPVFIISAPMMQGLIWGAIFGNIPLGMRCGAQIQLVYLGVVAVGANLPSDSSLASVIAIPIALMNHMTPEMCLTIAVPFGILGTTMDNVRRMINGAWNRKAHRDADKLNYKGIYFDALIGPILVSFPIRVIPVATVMYFGAGNADKVLAWLPNWLSNGFEVLGGVLPVIGIVVCVRMIGRKNLLPYFVIGYFLMRLTSMSTLIMAIFATMVALIHVMLMPKNAKVNSGAAIIASGEREETANEGKQELKYALTKREINLTCWLVIFCHRIAQSMEYFYGTGTCFGMLPVLRKLYGHDDEKMKAALHRHLTPYISEMTWGHCIIGAAVAMEEQMANGADISPESITAVKTGLMGPFAGLGDTIQYFIMMPIILSILIPYSAQGSIIGAFGIPLLMIWTHTTAWLTYQFGYKKGKDSLLDMLRGGWIDQLMVGAGVLGMFMMGALGANYVSLTTPLTFSAGSSTFAVQSFFNAIFPGFLPFVLIVISYFYLSRGGNNIRLMLMLLAMGIIGSIIGFF